MTINIRSIGDFMYCIIIIIIIIFIIIIIIIIINVRITGRPLFTYLCGLCPYNWLYTLLKRKQGYFISTDRLTLAGKTTGNYSDSVLRKDYV
jgi:hypothetical protein